MTSQNSTTILYTRNLITGRPEDTPTAGAIHVKDGRIQHVEFDPKPQDLPRQNLIDLGDRTLMPGFVDPHAHTEVMARTDALTVDCRAPERKNCNDVIDKLRSELGSERDGWLVGQANLFFDQKIEEKRFPTREELDSVSTEVAIALRCGGHITVLNSKGLEAAGITATTGQEFDSITGKPSVELDEQGNPTGIVKEMDSLLPLPTLPERELPAAIERTLYDRFTRFGVTTVGEIGETKVGAASYDALLSRGSPIPRMHLYLWAPGFAPLEEAISFSESYKVNSPSDLFSIHGIKIFADGGYSAKSAAMSQHYRDDPCHFGEIAFGGEQIKKILQSVDHAGLQLAVHANGDRAQMEVCKAIAEVRDISELNGPAPRVEHAGNFVPHYEKLTAAWQRAGIKPVSQPIFLYNFGEFVPDYVGDYAKSGQFPFRTLLDDGWAVCGSSDVWIGSEIDQTNPFLSIASLVGRKTFHGYELEPEQAVSPLEAISMHTLNAAAAMGLDKDYGSIETGKFADMIVLDRDPVSLNVEEYREIVVEAVYRAGELIHQI